MGLLRTADDNNVGVDVLIPTMLMLALLSASSLEPPFDEFCTLRQATLVPGVFSLNLLVCHFDFTP